MASNDYNQANNTGLKVGIIGFGVVGSATANRLYELGNEIYVHDIRPPEQLKFWRDEFKFRETYYPAETDATLLILPTAGINEKLYQSLPWEVRRHFPEGAFGESLDKSAFVPVIEYLANMFKGLEKYHLVVVRSTVEPGTTREFGKEIERKSGKTMGKDFSMAMIPEFLRAFNSQEDEKLLPKLVVGHHDKPGLDLVRRIYQNLPQNADGSERIYPLNLEEAELVKLLNNAINAIRISFHNSLEEFCEALGDKGMHTDYDRMTKVLTTMTEAFTNPSYGIRAGIPFGGTCLRKDPNALHSWAEDTMGIRNYFTATLGDAIHENLHLQRKMFNDHQIPLTTRDSLEALASRGHGTYDNIQKTADAVGDVDGTNRNGIIKEGITRDVSDDTSKLVEAEK